MLKEQQTSSSPSPSSSSFFLFPNPYPLLRSFNIPAPVIHPPGIDPNSLLNPNPHGNDGLEPLTSLDVDPCAEIITKSTDSTASEPEPMNEDGKVLIVERCKRKINSLLVIEEDADTKRRR
ncbi:unnamed protein product [Lactuca virosa]|uniref:Uncharacterized protein n=1 Tax=Lactuca virosa TaxID=75947 RepID=A0AAU9M354_9ASTR|nr:unnamed protein product [Lactuca virosa]